MRPAGGQGLDQPAKQRAAPRPLDRLQGVADLPERRRPEADEERAPLGVAALVLVDRLGADPEADAQSDRSERERVKMEPAETGAVQRVDDHDRALPAPPRVHSTTDGY